MCASLKHGQGDTIDKSLISGYCSIRKNTMATDQIREMRKISIVTMLSGAVEWYCFMLFGLVTGVVFNSSSLFTSPTWSEFTKASVGWLVFALGFAARPFGAVFFGNLGDKAGRKASVIASLMTMGISTFIIGCLPCYDKAGVWSIVLLQFFYLVQCFGLGGSWGGGILMAFENADPKKKAFYAAVPQAGLPAGLTLAGLVLLVPYKLWHTQFLIWGWRVGFWIAILFAFLVLYIKVHIMETRDFQELQKKLEAAEKAQKQQAMPLVKMFKNYWKTILLGIGTRWIDGTMYNVFAVWSLSYLTRPKEAGGLICMDQGTSLLLNIIFALVNIPMVFFTGALADKFGKGKIYSIGALSCAIWTIPGLLILEKYGSNPAISLLVIIIGWSICYSGIWATLGSLWSQLFETEVRYSAISFVYHAPAFFVGGLVPYICEFLASRDNGHVLYIGIFAAAVALVSLWSGIALQRRHDRQVALSSNHETESPCPG